MNHATWIAKHVVKLALGGCFALFAVLLSGCFGRQQPAEEEYVCFRTFAGFLVVSVMGSFLRGLTFYKVVWPIAVVTLTFFTSLLGWTFVSDYSRFGDSTFERVWGSSFFFTVNMIFAGSLVALFCHAPLRHGVKYMLAVTVATSLTLALTRFIDQQMYPHPVTTRTRVDEGPEIEVEAGTIRVLVGEEFRFGKESHSEIWVRDPAIDQIRVGVSVQHGWLSLSGDVPRSVKFKDCGNSQFTFAGPTVDVNRALTQIVYRPAAGFSGRDRLNVHADDQELVKGGQHDAGKVIKIDVVKEDLPAEAP